MLGRLPTVTAAATADPATLTGRLAPLTLAARTLPGIDPCAPQTLTRRCTALTLTVHPLLDRALRQEGHSGST
jgi:hypothetical protein